ncbi:MAG: SpoIIE family protein phosphatase, partial [Bacteroidales bacterium]|nr:SpoIIE family protein phosphatase [Bacteroidales bacterium]
MFKKNLILFFFLFSVAYLNAQQLSSSSQQKVDAKIEALSTASTNADWSEEIRLNKEIADIYQKNRLYSQAIPYFKKAHQISKTNKQSVLQRRMAISLSMIGIQLGNFSEALNYTIEVNEISKNIGLSKKNIYDEIITIGYLYRKTNNYQKSYETLKEIESKVLFEAYDEKLVDRFYREIAAVCKANGDTKNYLKYTNILEKRHINKTEAEFNQKTAGFVETVHEQNKKIENIEQVVLKQGQTLQSYQDSLIKAATAKRESDYKLKIQDQNLIIKQNELEQEKLFSRTLTFGLIFLLLIIGVVSYLTILIKKSNTQIKKSKQEIETQNTELEQKNEQISKKNEQISSGIRYAKNIQIATLLPIEYLKKAFPTFILYKAKDIVSGDFYWHAIKNDKTTGAKLYFSAVVDCTGHGVPGAFMSLIGVRLLNEILFEKGIEDPAKILERLNSELQIALRQSETEND